MYKVIFEECFSMSGQYYNYIFKFWVGDSSKPSEGFHFPFLVGPVVVIVVVVVVVVVAVVVVSPDLPYVKIFIILF